MLRTSIKTTVVTGAAVAAMMIGPQTPIPPAHGMQLNKPKPRINVPRPHIGVRPPRVRVPVRTRTRRLIKHRKGGDDTDTASGGGGGKAARRRIATSNGTDVADVPLPERRPAVHTAALPKADPRSERARDLFAKLGGPARLQELERLRKQEEGGLEAAPGAFSSEGDCRDFGGHASIGVGCGGDGQENAASPDRNRNAGLSTGPWGQDSNTRRPPRPSADNGTSEPDSYFHPGRASAQGQAGAKDFGQGQAKGDGATSSCSELQRISTCESSGDPDDGDWYLYAEGTDEYGNKWSYKERSPRPSEHRDGFRSTSREYYDNGYRESSCIDGECTYSDVFTEPYDGPDEAGAGVTGGVHGGDAGGGDAGQPNPVDTGGGNNNGWGAACLTLGIGCDLAKSDTLVGNGSGTFIGLGQGRSDKLTPQEIFEMVGQPMPAPGRDQAADKDVDRSGIAGFTPGCDATPGGCGGAAMTGSNAAAVELDLDSSIAGFEPVDPRDPHH